MIEMFNQKIRRFFNYYIFIVKRDELLAAVDSLITCIRCCASYTWAMQSRIDQKSPCGSGSSSTDQQRRRIKTTVRSVEEAVLRTPEKYINIGSI